jgi:hypothetical protein
MEEEDMSVDSEEDPVSQPAYGSNQSKLARVPLNNKQKVILVTNKI